MLCLPLYWIIVVFPLCGCCSVISMHFDSLMAKRASLIAQLVKRKKKNPPAMQESPLKFLGQEDPLEKG